MTCDTGKNGGRNKGTWHPGENLSCVGGGVAPNRAKTCRQRHHYQERGQRCGRKANPCPLPSWCLNMRVQRQDKQAQDACERARARARAHTHTHTHTHHRARREDEEGRRMRGGWEGGGEGIREDKGRDENNRHKYFILFFLEHILVGTSLVVQWLRFLLQFLVGELRSYMPHRVPKKYKKKKKKKN